MSKKTIDIGFAVCLMISGIVGLIHGVAGIAGLDIPDAAVRALGIISLIDLPVLVFFSVRKIINGRGSKNK